MADKQTKLDLHAALRGADLAEGYAVLPWASPWPPSIGPIGRGLAAVAALLGWAPAAPTEPDDDYYLMACTRTTSTPQGVLPT